MPKPPVQPIGLQVRSTSRVLSRAFERALAEVDGSLPAWLVLVSVKSGSTRTQRELAAAVGIEGATLTHHLDGMERAGVVTRRRDPSNRRVQIVELTEAGEEAFERMRKAVIAFDRRLRKGISEKELDELHGLLDRLRANVED
jgi:MarR family transcriptional regulator, transcriptional regulator for hemolysin